MHLAVFQSRRAASSHTTSPSAQWLLLIAILLLLATAIGWNSFTEYRFIEARERERLSTQARIVDENLGRQLVATHLALDSIRNDLPYLQAQKDRAALINRRLQSTREAMPGMRAVSIFDASGTLLARSPDRFVGQNFSDREYFQVALHGGDAAKLYVSPPFLASTGEYVINVVKVLLDEDGRFAGIVLGSLDPGYFSILLESVRYTDDMWSALTHGDGKLFLMIPARPGVEGMNLAQPGSFYTRHIQSGQKATVMSGIVYATGEERMIALRTIQPADVPMDKPLVVAVARDLPNIFALWRRSSYEHGGMFVLLLLATTLGLNYYQKRQRIYDSLVASQEVERKRAENDMRIAAAAFDSQEGMMVTDANGVILRVNKAFVEITGYSVEEAVGQTPRLFKSDRHDADFYRSMWALIIHTGGWQGEIWDRRKNGQVYPKWLTISAVKNDEGAVTHYIGAHYDITERKLAEERINALAFFDQLTALPNRTLLLDRLKQTMTLTARSGHYGALLFIDLDKFKTLNDSLGHDMGDLLLQQVAQRLVSCVRAGDTVARLGGDEFVVMLASLSLNEQEAATQTEAIGEKIHAKLNQTYSLKGAAYHSTPSIGATLFSGQQTEIEVLLKQADLAMYKAKDAGRNALRFFDPDMEVVVMKRAALEKDLHEALQENQFMLHYQAQMADGQLTGAEVLLRWQHPRRGMVSPAEFIPLAEETGLILPLGHWVLTTACTQLAIWAARPELAHLTVAVNVSALQFRQPDFVNQVGAVLQQTGANPYRLKLELTESLLVSNVDEVIEKMFALKARGVGFSLDDFGTGYSSLSYLKRLPLDQLKIDQSFVRDILSDPNDAAIAKTIIALAESLGLGVIAEGVETAAQRDFLADSGCYAYQGYFFSRPLPLNGFEEFARRV